MCKINICCQIVFYLKYNMLFFKWLYPFCDVHVFARLIELQGIVFWVF